MNKEKLIPIAKGMIKHIPGVKLMLPKKTGGTIDSRYCYTVWLRHLKKWNKVYDTIPANVAELGPGDSLGIGLSALLSGCKQLYALDVVKYWDEKRNLKIFEELIELFRKKTPIPDNEEFPRVRPSLENYGFPSNILTDQLLGNSLEEKRLNTIKNEIKDIDNPKNSFIKFRVPWQDSNLIQNDTLDFVFSQAVLEYVDLDLTYHAMHKWLKPAGLMSHTIDFRSHGATKSWNGHWTFTNLEWDLITGGKYVFINRHPYSKHIEQHTKYKFEIIENKRVRSMNKFHRNQLSCKFKNISDVDITTSGVYLLSKKKHMSPFIL